MKNNRWIIVFDFETDGKDHKTCNPTELAAVPVDPDSLEVKTDNIFNVTIKPENIDKDSYFTDSVNETIAWHAKQREVSNAEIIEKWKNGLPLQVAIKNFYDYTAKFHIDKRPGQYIVDPIPAGYNIIGYDIPIMERIIKALGYKKMPFSTANRFDLYDNICWWFENLEEPKDLKLDTLRDFLGLKKSGQTHEAIYDVLDTANILTRFIKFHRKQASINKFKGAFGNG